MKRLTKEAKIEIVKNEVDSLIKRYGLNTLIHP
jgi:hypothetical protein